MTTIAVVCIIGVVGISLLVGLIQGRRDMRRGNDSGDGGIWSSGSGSHGAGGCSAGGSCSGSGPGGHSGCGGGSSGCGGGSSCGGGGCGGGN